MAQLDDRIFLRSNSTGSLGLRARPYAAFKVDRPDTNLYDDLHEIYCQLKIAAKSARNLEQVILRSGGAVSPAIASGHYTLLARPGDLAKQLEFESRMIPEIWHAFTKHEYRLTPIIKGFYTTEQLEYRPLFIPGEALETERPFMRKRDRDEDDMVRAHKRAVEIGRGE